MTTFDDLDSMNEAEWDKVIFQDNHKRRDPDLMELQCWAVNCKAQLHLLRKACPIFNANPDGGVFLVTASVAGVGVSGSSMAYSVSKAAGALFSAVIVPRAIDNFVSELHLVKCLAATQGPKIRVNAISPGLLLTEWVGRCLPSLAI